MMFFKKFFDKSFKHYKEKGDKYLDEERYADARHAYSEAIDKLGNGEATAEEASEIRRCFAETGNKLALANIGEAEHAARAGDTAKALDHLQLARELADDASIQKQAEQLEREFPKSTASQPSPPRQSHGHSCNGCATPGAHGGNEPEPHDDHLVAEDRFSFLLHTLPEPLAKRYGAMGETFAGAYLAAHEGDEREGLRTFEMLLEQDENDILLYEIAIIHFRNGRLGTCEELLRRAINLNPGNELCYLGLVQLLVESGRAHESIGILEHMVSEQMVAGQASIMLADVHLQLGDQNRAMDLLSSALKDPVTAKAAAERLIPVLESLNRREEAAYLFKTHMKGCC